jgi:hypothetical protein
LIHYLYVKTHNYTGLKYLGATQKSNLHKYPGSGSDWTEHLKVHGSNFSTELIGAFDSVEDLAVAGQFWSKNWNVVESDEWANLKEESGQGCWSHEGPTKTTCQICLEQELAEQIKAIAARNGMSFSAYVRQTCLEESNRNYWNYLTVRAEMEGYNIPSRNPIKELMNVTA